MNVNNLDWLLKNNRVGWMKPDGSIIETSLFCHFEFFRENKNELPEIIERIESFEEYWRDVEQDHLEWSLAEDEHPAWHVIEIAKDNDELDLKKELYDYAYDQGWARIGTFKRNNIKFLEVETNEKTKKKIARKAKELAELVDRELKWNIV